MVDNRYALSELYILTSREEQTSHHGWIRLYQTISSSQVPSSIERNRHKLCENKLKCNIIPEVRGRSKYPTSLY